MGNQLALAAPSPTDATGQEEEEGDKDEVGVEEVMTMFLGRRGHLRMTAGSDKRTVAAADSEQRAVVSNSRRTAEAMEKERAGAASAERRILCFVLINYHCAHSQKLCF